jgi:NAD(P)H-dependent flavin oxidoreductase YrpB (nitropropane dioxygenase family)
MKQVKKPWIAYKVLAAGAIKPHDGIDYAFKNGADFACVGMFDFQVTQDATIARNAVKEHKNRRRPWRA